MVRRKGEEALILALASGASVNEASRLANVSPNTIYRNLRDPAFRLRIDETRTAMVRQTIGRLSNLGERACGVLERRMEDDERPGLQLTAARAALDFLFRAHDHETLARQIEALKRQIEEITSGDSRAHQADARPGNAPGKQDDGTGRSQPSASTPGRSDAPDDSDGLDGGPLAEEGPDLDEPPPPAALFPRSG